MKDGYSPVLPFVKVLLSSIHTFGSGTEHIAGKYNLRRMRQPEESFYCITDTACDRDTGHDKS